jgi:hypothetical protein
MAVCGDRARWRGVLGLVALLVVAGPVAAETPRDLEEFDALLERLQQRIERWDEPAPPAVETPAPPGERVEEPAPPAAPETATDEAWRAELQARDARIALLEGEIARLEARLAETPDELQARDGRIAELQAEIAGLEARLAETPDAAPRLPALEQELATARAQRTSLEMRLDAALARQEELERRLEAEAARVRELERQRDLARAEVAVLAARPPRTEPPPTSPPPTSPPRTEPPPASPPPASPLLGVHELVRVAMSRAEEQMVQLAGEAPGSRLAEGELLILEIEVPDGRGHLQVDYFKTDGRVVHLHESTRDRPPLAGGQTALVGDPFAGDWFEIAPPFGEELILVVASPAPLFDGRRPGTEDARGYLEALALAIERQPARPVAGTLAIETVPRR